MKKGPELVKGKRRVTRNPAKPDISLAVKKRALKKLGLDPANPPRTPALATKAVLSVGSREDFLDYARSSDHSGVIELLEKYDALPDSYKNAVTIVDLCKSVEIGWEELVGEVVRIACIHNADLSNLIAAVNQPKVVEATIAAATRAVEPSVEAQKILHQHHNFVPVPKGSQTTIRFQQLINGSREVAEGAEVSSLPPFEQDSVLFSNAQRGKLLPAESEG